MCYRERFPVQPGGSGFHLIILAGLPFAFCHSSLSSTSRHGRACTSYSYQTIQQCSIIIHICIVMLHSTGIIVTYSCKNLLVLSVQSCGWSDLYSHTQPDHSSHLLFFIFCCQDIKIERRRQEKWSAYLMQLGHSK